MLYTWSKHHVVCRLYFRKEKWGKWTKKSGKGCWNLHPLSVLLPLIYSSALEVPLRWEAEVALRWEVWFGWWCIFKRVKPGEKGRESWFDKWFEGGLTPVKNVLLYKMFERIFGKGTHPHGKIKIQRVQKKSQLIMPPFCIFLQTYSYLHTYLNTFCYINENLWCKLFSCFFFFHLIRLEEHSPGVPIKLLYSFKMWNGIPLYEERHLYIQFPNWILALSRVFILKQRFDEIDEIGICISQGSGRKQHCN